jgi:hypothetical protein
MSPYGWGHSLLLGRAKYHLRWTLQTLNANREHELVRYLQNQAKFPDFFTVGHNHQLLTSLLKVKGFGSYELAAVMLLMPFALACCSTPTSQRLIKAWCLENILHLDYYRSSFTELQIRAHTQNWLWLKCELERLYGAYMLLNKVKFHDPEHDEEIIRGYGNFRIINELPKERIHQLPKHTPHNNRTEEEQMLSKVTCVRNFQEAGE